MHRDLKPENILLCTDGDMSRIKLIDFGLAVKQESSDFTKNEDLHDCGGTAYYMAPEYTQGEYTSKIDIWAIGVTVYRILTGRLPFIGEDSDEVFDAILT